VEKAIIGAGPAALYLDLQRRPDRRVEIVEQNGADSTSGLGVVLADSSLSQRAAAGPRSCRGLQAALHYDDRQIIVHACARLS